MAAPRSSAWVAWAWRSQCGDGRPSRDAAAAAAYTRRRTCVEVRKPPPLREANTDASGGALSRMDTNSRSWQQDDARLAALAVGSHLAGIATFAQVAPGEMGNLIDTQASGVQQPQQDVVASRPCFLQKACVGELAAAPRRQTAGGRRLRTGCAP